MCIVLEMVKQTVNGPKMVTKSFSYKKAQQMSSGMGDSSTLRAFAEMYAGCNYSRPDAEYGLVYVNDITGSKCYLKEEV